MTLRTIHPCAFNFKDQDIRRVGMITDGGTSLSGISEPIESSGGGYWMAEFSNGQTRTEKQGLAWRALVSRLQGGAASVIVLFCEKLFQPIDGLVRPPLEDHDPGELTTSYGAAYTASAAALRATTITIAGDSEKPLQEGMRFSIEHATWGWRAYEIDEINGTALTFMPPLREAIANGTALDFDNVRCQMRAAQAAGNPTNMGRYTSCALVLVEDMRKPA